MKYSEMNERQKKAFKNIKFAAYDYIGGLENTLMDYSENDDVYICAQETLNNHQGLVEELYRLATTYYFDEGLCIFGKQGQQLVEDVKFCGKDFLMQLCDERVTKEGY